MNRWPQPVLGQTSELWLSASSALPQTHCSFCFLESLILQRFLLKLWVYVCICVGMHMLLWVPLRTKGWGTAGAGVTGAEGCPTCAEHLSWAVFQASAFHGYASLDPGLHISITSPEHTSWHPMKTNGFQWKCPIT